MIKKVVFVVLCIFVVTWSFRIDRINTSKTDIYQYDMDEEIRGDNISVKAKKALFLAKEDYIKNFALDGEIFEMYGITDGKIICVCLEVENISEESIEWDRIVEWTYCGFESRTWASTNMAFLVQNVNCFQTDSLAPGESQTIWYATLVNPVCFKSKTWKCLEVDDFGYVISLEPKKLVIRLE